MPRYHITIAIVPDINSTDQHWFLDEEFDALATPEQVTDTAQEMARNLGAPGWHRPGDEMKAQRAEAVS